VELYDLDNDPLEQTNLAGQAEAAAVEADLRDRLHTWMRETGDPLADGMLPLSPAFAPDS
jgi:arylsulfatase A-like enzyme